MNEDKLQARARAALAASDGYSARGPKTRCARHSLAHWLETGRFMREYLVMPNPESAIRWLEYVIKAERGKARMEAIRRVAQETEERL